MGGEKRKFINSLVSAKGVKLDNIENISEEILNFFKKLYNKPSSGHPFLERVLLG